MIYRIYSALVSLQQNRIQYFLYRHFLYRRFSDVMPKHGRMNMRTRKNTAHAHATTPPHQTIS